MVTFDITSANNLSSSTDSEIFSIKKINVNQKSPFLPTKIINDSINNISRTDQVLEFKCILYFSMKTQKVKMYVLQLTKI